MIILPLSQSLRFLGVLSSATQLDKKSWLLRVGPDVVENQVMDIFLMLYPFLPALMW